MSGTMTWVGFDVHARSTQGAAIDTMTGELSRVRLGPGIDGRHVARRVSFAPLLDPSGVGNGVHVHVSLHDADGPATHDETGTLRLSASAESFAAGVLAHLPAVVVLSASSPVSYTPMRTASS